MFRGIKDYLHFNKAERNGIISLLLLIVITIIVKQNLHHFQIEQIDNSDEYNQLLAKVDSLENIQPSKSKVLKNESAITNRVDSLFPFNPNTTNLDDWQKLGLSEKQAEVVLNYQAKGGKFRVKKDVQKMFVISDSLYADLKPFIRLPDTINYSEESYKREFTSQPTFKKVKFKKRIYPKVLLNSADTAEFKKLYGIGEVLADRIVKQREALGGFYSKSQLSEIFGLREEVLLQLDTQLVFNPISLRKIKLNSVTKEELKAHPYIYWKQANAIVNYRNQHGNYKKIEDLKKVILVSDSLYHKIEPYLAL